MQENPTQPEATIRRITLPAELAGLRVVVSVSGGKDSTATMLALREAGIPFEAVFADTGWEAAETYAYLEQLEQRLGLTLHRVGHPGGMIDRIQYRAGFPARMQRWCTQELKTEPIRKYLASLGDDIVSAVGVRADESVTRSKYAELEDDHEWGGWVWRPILRWSVEDVLAIHQRHDIPLNPLYHRGHDRVGCYPCIFARKEEIRLIADHSPERIDLIRKLEVDATAERARRNAERPGRYAHPVAAFFQTRVRGNSEGMSIDEIVAWSRTDRRGLPVLMDVPSGGCFRWGMCERPGAAAEADAEVDAEQENPMGKNENTRKKNDEVCTPRELLEAVRKLGPIGFDPCSAPASIVEAATTVLLPKYWTDPDNPPPLEQVCGDQLVLWGDGLTYHWGEMGLVFVNPPYSALSKQPWIAKARDEADEAVLFLPVRTAGAWWQDEVTRCQAVTFLRGRVVHEGEEDGAPFHQCLVYCGPRVERWVEIVTELQLGWTVLGEDWKRGV